MRIQLLTLSFALWAGSASMAGLEDNEKLIVLAVKGSWQRAGGQALEQYDTLVPTEEIRCANVGKLKPPARRSALPKRRHEPDPSTIDLLAGGTTYHYGCRATVPMPKPPKPSGAVTAFLSAVSALLRADSAAIPRQALVRGSASPVESVLLLDGVKLEAGPALSPLRPNNKYRLQFRPIQGRPGPPLAEIDVLLAENGSAQAETPQLSPGLFRLDVVTADDRESAVGAWVPVLVASGDRYTFANKALQQAHDCATQADPPLSAEAAHALNVLVLAGLATR